MDSFSSFVDSQFSSRNRWSYDSLKNFRQISPVVQTHLKRVYLSLCCALLASAVGVYLHILWNLGGILTSLGCMGCIIWLLCRQSEGEGDGELAVEITDFMAKSKKPTMSPTKELMRGGRMDSGGKSVLMKIQELNVY
ncbi:Bax inhibitor 1 [Orobanche minor]